MDACIHQNKIAHLLSVHFTIDNYVTIHDYYIFYYIFTIYNYSI